MSTPVEHIGVAYGSGASRAGVRPAVVVERRPGRPGGSIKVVEWNTSQKKFNGARWIAEHEVRPALPETDARVSAMLQKVRDIETLAEIDEMS